MRRLIWKVEAQNRFLETLEYIAQKNSVAAVSLESAVLRQVQMLERFPELGRPGRVAGTRELVVHPNFLIIYVVEPEIVRIIALIHARQRYP